MHPGLTPPPADALLFDWDGTRRDWFDAIVTRDDVERGKPAPDIFLNAAAALHADPARCVVCEDSDEGINAARAAGMHFIDVRPYTGRGA